ncbi:MAG: hypothetical protein D6B27_12170 [Gammaproteobacteria bacterium]|nr:MAG: hypothetical protein D6B27_12170 [Gammaproteobacteria bacterium]
MKSLLFAIICLQAAITNAQTPNCDFKSPIKTSNNIIPEFFKYHSYTLPWYIIRHENGSFENTLGEDISNESIKPIEKNAFVFSTHQSNHLMNMAEATKTAYGFKISIFGGMPAYCSSLDIHIMKDKFCTTFEATYPAPIKELNWKIISQKLTLISSGISKEKRIQGKVSIILEEKDDAGKVSRHRIAGYFKPPFAE